MKRILDWLTWLLWTSEVVFLAASTPHIATYFEHFDNPTDVWSTAYAWAVGYGLALTIDGVTFVILMSLVVAIKYRRPWWLTSFLVFSLLLISTLSWFINWQYDIVFSSSTFAKADSIVALNGMSIGTLNPLIGGAFPLLSVLYALVAKALEVDEGSLVKTALTPEQFENEKQRLIQEQELKSLKASQRDGKGLLSRAQETLIGQSRTSDELLNSALSLLREAPDLLQETSQEQALQALSGYLKVGDRQALSLLYQARSIVLREEHEERLRQSQAAHEESIRQARLDREERERRERREEEERLSREKADHEAEIERLRLANEAEIEKARLAHEAAIEKARADREVAIARLQVEREEKERLAREAQEERLRQETVEQERLKIQAKTEQEEALSRLEGRSTVSLEEAASLLGYDRSYIVRLRNENKLKHGPRREDQITVASIRAYQANHKRRKDAPTETVPVVKSANGHAITREQDTDPLQLPAL